jgi:osmoprotectant transport system ATP-binding protein
MREGKIVQRGSYRDLIDAPAEQFVTDFVKAQRSLHDEVIDA